MNMHMHIIMMLLLVKTSNALVILKTLFRFYFTIKKPPAHLHKCKFSYNEGIFVDTCTYILPK